MTTDASDGRCFPLLSEIRVLNAATGFPAAIAGKLLSDLGASVLRYGQASADPAASYYPAYEDLRAHEAQVPPGDDIDVLARAVDVVIVGGEDFPGSEREEGLAERLAAADPRLILLDLQAYPPGCGGGQAVDILTQARAGLVFEHYPDRPNLMAFLPTYYGAALQGVEGVAAALVARGRLGRGQVVSTSLLEGALTWVTTWNEAERPDQGFNFVVPLDPRPLILKCADGDYVHLVLGAANSKYALYKLLGIEDATVLPGDSGTPKRHDPPEKFYGDLDLIAPLVEKWKRDDLLAALGREGIAVAMVQKPGEVWDDPQTIDQQLVVDARDGRRMVGKVIQSTVPGPPTQPEADRPRRFPLEGVRVLDFGVFTAGPLASLLLAKLGADVIKVEPISGDPSRNMPRANMAANRGKRSIAVDMKSAGGRKVVDQLLSTADVVISNFRTGVAAKLGIDGRSLLGRFPRMVVLEAPAFGLTGPRATEAAFDLVMQAFCGFEVRAGGEGNRPIWNRTFLSDYGGGHLGAIGVMAALHHRQLTGRGAMVEASLFSAAFLLHSETIRLADGSFMGSDLLNSQQTGFHLGEGLYQAADGWLAIDARGRIEAFGEALGLGTLDAKAEVATIAAAIAERSVNDNMVRLKAAGIGVEPCRPGMEHATLNDPALRELGIVEQVEHPQYGLMSQMGSLFRLSGTSVAPAARAPALGEHSDAILGSLGWDEAGIAQLRTEGSVG